MIKRWKVFLVVVISIMIIALVRHPSLLHQCCSKQQEQSPQVQDNGQERELSLVSHKQSSLKNLGIKAREHFYDQAIQKEAPHNEIQDCFYDGSTGNSGCYDVFPRTAYYDNRMVSNKPNHTVYILAEMEDSQKAADSIVACELNGHKYYDISVRKDSTRWSQEHFPGQFPFCTHFIKCHGIPKKSVKNGDIVKVIYRKMGNKALFRVATEKPLVLTNPAGPKKFTKGKGSVVVCTTLYGHPPYFNEWLKYQQTLGIDKVHINIHESFEEGAHPFLQEALASGFAEIQVWKQYVKSYSYSMILKYVDCVMKHAGVYEYGFFYDVDDFFNPIIPNQKNIHYYANQYFKDESIASVRVPWFKYVCRPKKELYKHRNDGNITDSLTSYEGFLQYVKSIHRLNGVEIVRVHEPLILFPGMKTVNANEKLAYFAHIRPMKDC